MLVVDTGPLVATAVTDDANHAACRALLEGHGGQLVTTALVIAEAAYLISRQIGAVGEAALYTAVVDGSLHVEDLVGADWRRIRELVEMYASLRLGGTDGSVIAVAERLNVTTVATLDRRHCSVVRPRHTEALELVP